jgi:hypothetical protein
LLGRTLSDEVSVGGWNDEVEALAEKQNIMRIPGGGRVAEVAEDLDLGRDTWDRLTCDMPTNEALSWIEKRVSVR